MKTVNCKNEIKLKRQINELEGIVFNYKKLEKTLRNALKREFNERENRIVKQTDEVIAANQQLKQETLDRIKAEEALIYREEFLRLITTLSTSFLRLYPHEIDSTIEESLKIIGEFVKVDRCYVMLFKETDKRISIKEYFEWCASGIEPQGSYFKEKYLDKVFPWFSNKIKKHTIIYFPTLNDFPAEAHLEKAYFLRNNTKSFIAVPMFCKGSFKGYVGFDSVQQKKSWAIDIIALLRIVGEIFANTLEYKRMEMAMFESEEKYKLLFEHASDAIIVLGQNYRVIDCNNAFIELINAPKHEIIDTFITKESNKILQEIVTLLKKNKDSERVERETFIVKGDERTIPVWLKATTIYAESGNFKRTIIHIRDISEIKSYEESLLRAHHDMKRRMIESTDNLTNIKNQLNHEIQERKRVENEVRLAYSELNQIFNTSADGIVIIDINFNVLHINTTFSKIFSIKKDKIFGKRCFDLFPSELCHTKGCPMQKILSGQERIEKEIEIIPQNGQKHTCILTVTPFRVYNNKLIGIIEYYKDMTEYKKTKANLLQQVLKNKKLFDISFEGFYIIDNEGNFIEVNHAFSNMTGYSKSDLLQMKIQDIEIRDSCFNTKTQKKSKNFNTSYLGKNGKIINVNVAMDLFKTDIETLYVAAVRDITNNQETNKQIRLYYSALDNIDEGIAILDLNGYFLYVNNSYALLHNHSPNELIGEHFSFCQKAHKRESETLNHSHIYELNEFIGEVWYSKDDGKLFPAQIHNTFIRDKDGLPIGKLILIKENRLFYENIYKGDETECDIREQKSILLPYSDKSMVTKRHKRTAIHYGNNRQIDYTGFEAKKDLLVNSETEFEFEGILGNSDCMRKLFHILPSVAESVSTVLLQGESGTGKHLFAKAIHNLSPRKERPFVILNCGALPDTLLESELFGYVAGAFTDAKKDKLGRFAISDGGTLFLDEIGDISPAMQVRLLRFLQERVYEPLGSTKSYKVDVRIIAATNKNLMQLVQEGKFRQDLFYRINVVKLDLPPLRERLIDIPILVNHIIKQLNQRQTKKVKGLANDTLLWLYSYHYPGNIRELENIIERAFVICDTDIIESSHLPEVIYSSVEMGASARKGNMAFAKMEAVFLLNALKENHWNRQATAHKLGIHKTTLYRKIKSLGLKVPQNKK